MFSQMYNFRHFNSELYIKHSDFQCLKQEIDFIYEYINQMTYKLSTNIESSSELQIQNDNNVNIKLYFFLPIISSHNLFILSLIHFSCKR